MNDLERLLQIARRKYQYDQQSGWGLGAITYLNDIKTEVDEVLEERPKARRCYLEDELADIIWNYANALIALENKQEITIDAVLRRACDKFDQRVTGIESGQTWQQVKMRQKQQLATQWQASKPRVKDGD